MLTDEGGPVSYEPSELVARLRRDDRVSYVERAFLERQLGLGRDHLELMPADVVTALLNHPNAVVTTVSAVRLLEQLDAHEARRHPVDVDYVDPVHDVPHAAVAIAHAPLEDDVTFDLTLRRDGTIDLDRDLDPLLSPDEAEHVAYALLRLVELHRANHPTEETDR